MHNHDASDLPECYALSSSPRYMKPFLFILVVAFIGIQFFRPDKNLSEAAPGANDLVVMHPPSAEVKAVLERACNDCHSPNTRYPWYAEVQPVAWWLNSHIEEAQEHLNFAKFGNYSKKRQLHKLEELIEEVEEEKMPLRSYKILHGDARLTDAEIKSLTDWAKAARAQIQLR